MINLSFLYRRRIPIVITLIILAPFFIIYWPGFKGRVIDKETGEPIDDAYVISFADHYPFVELFNVGGANSNPDSMQVTKTDKNGYFHVRPYFKFSCGWIESRSTYIFKKGYVYATASNQVSRLRQFSRRRWHLETRGEIKSVYKTNDFYLSNNEALRPNGEPIGNQYLGLRYWANRYHDYYKYKWRYKRVRPLFLDIYQILKHHSNDIRRTFHEPHLIHNWDFGLAGYSDSLGLTSGEQWVVGKNDGKQSRPVVSEDSDSHMKKLEFMFKELDKYKSFGDSRFSEYLIYHEEFYDSKLIAQSLREKQFIKQSYCKKLITLYNSFSNEEVSKLNKYSINPRYNHQKEVVEYCDN